MAKAFSRQTPGLMMQLGRQLRQDNDRRQASRDADRLDNLAIKFAQEEDKSATGLIKFGVEHEASIQEMDALQTHFQDFTDQTRKTQEFNQKQTDRDLALADDELTRRQVAADRLRKGVVQGQQDTNFANTQEAVEFGKTRRPLQEELIQSQINRNNRVPVGARGAAPKPPAHYGTADSVFRKYNAQDEFGNLGDNQPKYLKSRELYDQKISKLPPNERAAASNTITNEVIREIDNEEKSVDTLDAIPKKALVDMMDNPALITTRISEALRYNSPEVVQQQMLEAKYSPEEIQAYFTEVQQQSIQASQDDIFNLRTP